MADYLNRTTPGVYINELSSFPQSVVGVETAVPAFIGYTGKAEIAGKPVSLIPTRITSLSDYVQIFGTGYMPVYKITPADDKSYNFSATDPDNNNIYYYNLVQTPDYNFNLYYSMKLFYANGGGTCYIVSVGNYGQNVNRIDLLKGLTAIAEQVGPTMLVIPDAVLLPDSDDFTAVVQEMFNQCGALGDRVAILDVYGAESVVDQDSLDSVITQFQTCLGERYLNYGAGYFPFLNSIVAEPEDFNYFDIALSDPATLKTFQTILEWDNKNVNGSGVTYDTINNTISKIGPGNTPQEIADNSKILSNLPVLHSIFNVIISNNSVLPPSGAMAGVYTYSDSTKGVWNAPANISLNSVTSTTYKLNDTQQGKLNVPLNGKAVNAIRDFVGRGSVVWGARTFDANNNDYRYIQVRRTIVYIEQSIKTALAPFVFSPNDANTWTTVTSMVSDFLTGVWSQGGLMGEKASDAFTVQCRLGSTMTGQDILDGYMIVQVTLQMIRPAEFIELTFKQKMEGA